MTVPKAVKSHLISSAGCADASSSRLFGICATPALRSYNDTSSDEDDDSAADDDSDAEDGLE